MSGNLYWIEEWTAIRRNELVLPPEEFTIHEDFLKSMDKEDFVAAFRHIWTMFVSIYDDMVKNPDSFGLPLYKREEYGYFSPQAREARNAPHRFFVFLYNILVSGEMRAHEFILDAARFKAVSDVKNPHLLFEKLQDYGFVCEGLKGHKIPKSATSIAIGYPDNPRVLAVLRQMTEKAGRLDRRRDFLVCHYRLFQDRLSEANYGNGADLLADQMHTKRERDFVCVFDEAVKDLGYLGHERSWNEGVGYAYYLTQKEMQAKSAYYFWLLSWKSTLLLYLRIRNVEKCLEYLQGCPDSVKQIFLKSDEGCANRHNGSCKSGVRYRMDGTNYWRCGCCNAAFYFEPRTEDIAHYIRLVELGAKK